MGAARLTSGVPGAGVLAQNPISLFRPAKTKRDARNIISLSGRAPAPGGGLGLESGLGLEAQRKAVADYLNGGNWSKTYDANVVLENALLHWEGVLSGLGNGLG